MSLVPRHSLFDLDHFFDNMWSPYRQGESRLGTFSPRVDVTEKDNAYQISAELPGVDKKDVHVTLDNGVLTIEAESNQEDKEEKDGKLIRQERRYGKFVRSFDLGPQVQDSDITANYDNGVLTLTAPKVDKEAPQSRRIEVL